MFRRLWKSPACWMAGLHGIRVLATRNLPIVCSRQFRFEPVSWDEAIHAIAEQLQRIVESVLAHTGVGETFDSLKSKGTVPMSTKPVVFHFACVFQTPCLPASPSVTKAAGQSDNPAAPTLTCSTPGTNPIWAKALASMGWRCQFPDRQQAQSELLQIFCPGTCLIQANYA